MSYFSYISATNFADALLSEQETPNMPTSHKAETHPPPEVLLLQGVTLFFMSTRRWQLKAVAVLVACWFRLGLELLLVLTAEADVALTVISHTIVYSVDCLRLVACGIVISLSGLYKYEACLFVTYLRGSRGFLKVFPRECHLFVYFFFSFAYSHCHWNIYCLYVFFLFTCTMFALACSTYHPNRPKALSCFLHHFILLSSAGIGF